MKKIVLLVVVLAGALVGVNYLRTGQVALFPAALSQEEKALRDLERELEAVEAQMAQAGRTASMTGADTTGDVAALLQEKERLEQQIAAARKKLGR
jgi:TolA-binding protein